MKHFPPPSPVALSLVTLVTLCLPIAGGARPAAPAGAPSPYRALTVYNGEPVKAVYINDLLCNGKPFMPITVTPRLTPFPGEPEVYVSDPVAARYDPARGQWSIVTESHADIPTGAYFDVRIGDGIVFRADAQNIDGFTAIVDDPTLDGNPGAKLQVTHLISPTALPEIYVPHPVGVRYDGTRWRVFHTDQTPVLPNECYSVVADGALCVFTLPSNCEGPDTIIDSPVTNGRPDLIVTVTTTGSANGSPSDIDWHPVGVRYDGAKWRIFNTDGAPMAYEYGFNVSAHTRPQVTMWRFNARGRLVVAARRLDEGSVIVVDGVDQPTIVKRSETANSAALLKVTKLTKPVPPGTTIRIEIRNGDGSLSETKTLKR